MPSYNQEKLLRMLEARQSAAVALRDLSDRKHHARIEVSRLEAVIRDQSGPFRSPRGFVDRLLTLPIDEARKLTADDVEGYRRDYGNATEIVTTGVSSQTYAMYLAAREKHSRLSADYATKSAEFQVKFAIVARLCEAVRGWGFPNPEYEV